MLLIPPQAEVGPPEVDLWGNPGIPDFLPECSLGECLRTWGAPTKKLGGTCSLAKGAFLRMHAPSCLRLTRPLLPLHAVCESFRCPHVQCGRGTALVEVWSPDRCCPYKSCGKSLDSEPLPKGPKTEIQVPGRCVWGGGDQAHYYELAQMRSLQNRQREAAKSPSSHSAPAVQVQSFPTPFLPRVKEGKEQVPCFGKGFFGLVLFFSHLKPLLQLSDTKHNFVKIHLWGNRWEWSRTNKEHLYIKMSCI